MQSGDLQCCSFVIAVVVGGHNFFLDCKELRAVLRGEAFAGLELLFSPVKGY